MQAFFKDDQGQLIATIVDDKLSPAPGADLEKVAFELFRMMMTMLTPKPNVTWGSAWMSGNMGSASSPGA